MRMGFADHDVDPRASVLSSCALRLELLGHVLAGAGERPSGSLPRPVSTASSSCGGAGVAEVLRGPRRRRPASSRSCFARRLFEQRGCATG